MIESGKRLDKFDPQSFINEARIGRRSLTVIPPKLLIDVIPCVKTDEDKWSSRDKEKNYCYDNRIGLRWWIVEVGDDTRRRS